MDGSMLVMTDSDALRIEDQDWSTLTLEAWPGAYKTCEVNRSVYEQGAASQRTDLTMNCDGKGKCMMCKKKMDMDKGDDDKKMCMEECSAEMKACAGDKESEEDFTRCMRGQMAKEDY